MATLSARTDRQTAKRAAVERGVLDATEALLAEGASYAELNIEQIATRAGIKRTAFYFYFRDRRELLMRLTEDVADRLYEEAEAWWRSEGDGSRALRRALESMISLYRGHDVLLRAVVEASAYDATVAEFWRAVLGRFVDATRARIEGERLRRPNSPPIPAHETAFALVWMTERTCYQRLAAGGDLGDEDFVRALGDVWLRAIYGRVD